MRTADILTTVTRIMSFLAITSSTFCARCVFVLSGRISEKK